MRPNLALVDVAIIALYVAFAFIVGALYTRKASEGTDSFFVGDRRLPWWVAGTSIVATTFAADTPLAVTGIVAADGISGNWIWWSWATAHLIATFFFARLWRRSGVITDAEITELRYGGRPAAWLRGFKALYFGIFINCLTMAWVIAAMVKISQAFFDVDPAVVISVCVIASVSYTTLGGFRGVVVTDLVQFALGMAGALILAFLVLDHLGGMGSVIFPPEAQAADPGLLGRLREVMAADPGRSFDDVVAFVPSASHPTLPPLYFVVLLFAGWWRYAEGNGYLVQRLAACKDEGHAQGASLWFAVAHNALRPWPWIVVGLASLVVYPALPGDPPSSLAPEALGGETAAGVQVEPGYLDVVTGGTLTVRGLEWRDCTAQVFGIEVPLVGQGGVKQATFRALPQSGVTDVLVHCGVGDARTALWRAPGLHVELRDREMGYPLMMGAVLPAGLLGLVIASLLAAFMSTIDTHTNWGASYLVQDVYRRFLRPDATEAHYVWVSRACIVLMAILAGLSALYITSIAAVWRFLINLGAGLGSVAAARWYWSRVTPHAEFAALFVTTVLAVSLEVFCTPRWFGAENPWFLFEVAAWTKILVIAGASLCAWIPVSLYGPPNDPAVLKNFYARVRPPGPGWRDFRGEQRDAMGPMALRLLAGLGVVFGSLFGIGDLLLGRQARGLALVVVAAALLLAIVRTGSKEGRLS
ncbi:MAG: sodium:solute symporter family protein [Myxococcota bacterium]